MKFWTAAARRVQTICDGRLVEDQRSIVLIKLRRSATTCCRFLSRLLLVLNRLVALAAATLTVSAVRFAMLNGAKIVWRNVFALIWIP